ERRWPIPHSPPRHAVTLRPIGFLAFSPCVLRRAGRGPWGCPVIGGYSARPSRGRPSPTPVRHDVGRHPAPKTLNSEVHESLTFHQPYNRAFREVDAGGGRPALPARTVLAPILRLRR